ncbi:MAG: DUF3574 domain-containing protein [Tistlia sp.]|uniref:DUF3574 domain-containing protein n=1 Tax=Tistlia sp. TaxID=3057121 RepID=UPI0034A16051
MTPSPSRLALPLAGLGLAGLLLAACLPASLPLPGPGDLIESKISCPPLLEAAAETRLYFGLGAGADGQPVGEADWQTFLDEVVTPRFPDGLTVLDAYGQWRADADAPVGREASKVLVVVVEDLRERLPDLRAVAGLYKHRFRQQSVLLTSKPVCAAF